MAQRGSMQEFLAMAVDAAKNAGQIIRSGFYQTKNVEHKGQAGIKRDKSTLNVSTNRINSLLFKVRSLRMSGSCALNLCGVACGRLDLFYELGFGGPWDITAGAVIVNEAGGVVFDSFEYFSNTKHFTSF